jgi:hypothetical protein
MASQRTRINFDPQVMQSEIAASFPGSLRQAFTPAALDWLNGTTASTADRFWCSYQKSLSNAATDSWDLRALTNGPGGATILLAEVRFLAIHLASGTSLTIGKGAANGWTALGASWTQTIKPVSWFVPIISGDDGDYATSASDKVIDILASGTCVYDIFVVGVSA